MKILFPHRGASKAEIEELLRFAIEGRKRIKDQLMRIDSTYNEVNFSYKENSGKIISVSTLEEKEFPEFYNKSTAASEAAAAAVTSAQASSMGSFARPSNNLEAQEKHLIFQENQKGLSFDKLFAPYLKGATTITVTDPYIRLFYQTRNFMEFLETVAKHKDSDAEVTVHLLTTEDEFKGEQQKENFEKMQNSANALGMVFTWEFDQPGTIHARHIVTNHGWKITLDRGLDIFQSYEMNDAFAFANRLQQFRSIKAFEATFIKIKESDDK